MAGAIFRPLNARWRMQRQSEDGRNLRVEAAEFIRPNDRLSSFERLEIYNRQVPGSACWIAFTMIIPGSLQCSESENSSNLR